MDSKQAKPFLDPVPWETTPALQNYPNVVTQPMDLGTVNQRIENNQYKTENEFVSDVRLIWVACYRYNGPAHDFSRKAQSLSKMFDRMGKVWAKSKEENDGRPKAFPELKRCQKLLKVICEHKYAQAFTIKFDPDVENLVGYREKIANMMDLSTVKSNLESFKYRYVIFFFCSPCFYSVLFY